MYNKYIDNGIDLNKDRHCDIEGWFVDKDGHHKPVLRDRGLAKIDKAFLNRYDLLDIINSFDAKSRLGETEIDSLHTYSLNEEDNYLSSPNVNKYLREEAKKDERLEKRIKQLDHIVNSYTLKKDINVFRGVSIKDGERYIKDFMSLRPGNWFFDDGFTSTSYSQDKAIEYGMLNNKNFIFFDITLRKGTHCVPLFKDNKTSKEDEFEILVGRRQKFTVKKVERIKSSDSSYIHYIKVESRRW